MNQLKNIKEVLMSNFAKSVLLIAGGTAFAQLLNTFMVPIITRIYSPKEYGILTVYTAILMMLGVIGSLKYEWGIAIADNDEKAINVLMLSMIVLLAVVGIITLIFIFFGKAFLDLIGGEVLFKYRFLIPLGILFTGLYDIFTQWAIRKKNFKSISKTKLSQSMAQNIIQVGFGLFNLGPITLILGRIFGQSAGITTLSIPFVKNDRALLEKINKKEIAWCAKRYIRFPLFSALSQFLNTASIQLPVLFIISLYGSQVIGFYGLANGVINLPTVLVGTSVGDVFYGEAASIGRTDPERLKALSTKLFRKLIIIGLVPLITLVLFGPFIFSLVFGQGWSEAGIYARIISFSVFTRLIFIPISRIYSVFERQKEALFLDALRVVLVLIVFSISKLISLNQYWAVGYYTIAISIVYLITFLWAQKIMNDEIIKHIINKIGKGEIDIK